MRPGIFLILLLFTLGSKSQVNIMGKPGYVNTPSAAWMNQKPLGFSFAHVPNNYSLFNNQMDGNKINFYSARANFTSFMSVNLSLAYRPDRADRIGLGDRQFDFRFRLFKETANFPAVVLGITPPGTRLPILSHDYLVLTKNVNALGGQWQFSAGYGSPFVFTRNSREDNTFWESLKIQKKKEIYGNEYLNGFFGAASYKPLEFCGIMLEYDSNTINGGIFVQPWHWLNIQGYTYEGKEWALSAALNFSLDFLPASIRTYEKF